MILSRFLEHLKQQHWTGVFIELVIVVLGVFIGLQVNNWNEAQQERALEKQYLQRLRDDLQLSVKNSEKNIASMEVQFRIEGDMLGDLKDCRLDPAQGNRFATGIFVIGKFQPLPLVRDTIDELRTTGRLVLLRDVRLRQKLAEALSHAQTADGVLQMIIARATPQIVYISQRAVLRQPEGGFHFPYGPYKEVQPGSIDFDFPTLCKDSRYAGAVSDVQELTRTVIHLNERQQDDYKALLKIIDVDLGRAG